MFLPLKSILLKRNSFEIIYQVWGSTSFLFECWKGEILRSMLLNKYVWNCFIWHTMIRSWNLIQCFAWVCLSSRNRDSLLLLDDVTSPHNHVLQLNKLNINAQNIYHSFTQCHKKYYLPCGCGLNFQNFPLKHGETLRNCYHFNSTTLQSRVTPCC